MKEAKNEASPGSSREVAIDLALLLLMTISIRAPYFFFSVINWDESTFIICGQSVLDGHLPYTDLWDVKPPLLFLPYAIFAWIAGRSIAGIRLVGSLWIFLSVALLYFAARRIGGRLAGLAAGGLLSVFGSSLLGYGGVPDGMALMSEHIAFLPLSGILYVTTLLVRRTSPPSAVLLFLLGALLSCSVLIRTNLAYLAPMVAIPPLIAPKHRIRNLFYVTVGTLIPFAVILTLYGALGELETLQRAMIDAPLALITSRQEHASAFGTALTLARDVWKNIIGGNWFICLLVFTAILHLFVKNFQREGRQICLIAVFGMILVLASIIKSRAGFTHYLLQLIPFAALVASIHFSQIARSIMKPSLTYIVLSIGLFSGMLLPLSDGIGTINRLRKGLPLEDDEGYQLTQFLRESGASGETIFLNRRHIIYWLLNAEMPTKIVHLSSFNHEKMLKAFFGSDWSIGRELTTILSSEPKFLVIDPTQWSFSKQESALLSKEIETSYEFVTQLGESRIFRRRAG